MFGENVRHTPQFLETGGVDAAIIALSLANVPGIDHVLIDAALHSPLNQAVGVVKRSRFPERALAFVQYVNGPEGAALGAGRAPPAPGARGADGQQSDGLPVDVLGRVVVAGAVGVGIGTVSTLLGVAGGELIIPALVLLFAVPIKAAGTLSLLISIPTILVGLAGHRARGAFAGLSDLRHLIVPMGHPESASRGHFPTGQ